VAPAGTPRDIVTRLNAELNKTLGSPVVAERLAALSFEPSMGPPDRLFDRALRETRLWADVVKRSGARID
jgi:tripartite-type tricarboxylate transporter receptor subunit TctC